jgi:Type II secretion system (T2SS), protein M subtype b
MMPVWKRIIVEKRSWMLPLAIAALANVGVYALVVYPLSVKSAGAAGRAAAAASARKAAEQDFAAARALVAGKSRAEQELTTFYQKVLPENLAAAVRLTYTPLPAVARKANVKVVSRRFETQIPNRDARLGRLHIFTSLQGDYEALRQFIYDLETAPEFVIIDDVSLAQAEMGKPLTLTLELSTYYPLSAHGN